MNPMVQKLGLLWPEISLALGACVCLFLGLWPKAAVRKSTALVAFLTLLVAGALAYRQGITSSGLVISLAVFVKLAVAGVGLLLLLVTARLPDFLPQIRQTDEAPPGRWIDPALVYRGEFFAFFLLSIAGVMLTAQADDLVWMFLALELVSLPTYVMVAVSRTQAAAQESAVKYFFLGALGVAFFLYGFTLIYGATGVTNFEQIRAQAGELLAPDSSPLLLVGVVLAVIGISFKIAAVPMHFYTADVYQGAASPVSAFLAFVPKTAGFVALILILSLVDPTGRGQYPSSVQTVLWLLAVATMTVGNVLGLLQTSVKRILAYSSIAHTGYMLVGLVAGIQATASETTAIGHGIAAILFYLVAYGLATLAAFAVLGCLHSADDPNNEADSLEDLAGLAQRRPYMAGVLLLALLSLIGLPPMVGFLGKIYLFGAAIKQGFLWLVIIAVLNSAVSAVYYLRIASVCFFAPPTGKISVVPAPSRLLGASLAAFTALFLGVAGGFLVDSAREAEKNRPATRRIIHKVELPPSPAPAENKS